MKECKYVIDVDCIAVYLEGESDPEKHSYVFAYTITIKNLGTVAAQLLSRHWHIVDASENVKEVKGDGVVGEQPHLEPGESFTYTSAAMIKTPVGNMLGSYQMQAADGHLFEAEIKPFRLSVPLSLH